MASTTTSLAAANAVLEPYVPRLVVGWLRDTPDQLWRTYVGSLAFIDISGFTSSPSASPRRDASAPKR